MVMGDPGSPDSAPNFAFAFNDVNFSDRILRIEISPDVPVFVSKLVLDDGLADADDSAPNRKRRRADQFGNANDSTIGQCEEQVLKCHVVDLEDWSTYGNQDTAGLMIEALPAGHDAEVSTEESASVVCSTINAVNVKTIHISSPILAAKSQFFYKLFSNGMKESEQRQVTLRIQASEEDAFMDLLNFMYSNTLQSTTTTTLLDVLMAADKYEVPSFMRYCSKLLRDKPMTCESALRYLNLPLHVLRTDSVLPLADAAKQFLATSFKDISKFQEEILNLPLAGFEAVLFSDYLQVASEDAIFDLVVKWARRHYPRLEERRHIFTIRLLRVIRFPCMTTRKLRKVLTCGDIEPDLVSKVVLDALFFKTEAPYRQRALISDEANTSFHHYIERAYRYRPVKVVEFELPHPQCIVYLDLKREECAQLFPTGRVYSVAFHLGGQGFFLSSHCNLDQQSSFHCFGLFLGMQDKGSDGAVTVRYEFASRAKPSWDFIPKYRGSYTFVGGKAVGYRNLFGVPWTAFIADDSPYFIDGVLHLKAELTIRK